jgi:imidazolonepropionase-like amidohydrolase
LFELTSINFPGYSLENLMIADIIELEGKNCVFDISNPGIAYDTDDRVKLVNARIVDVENGRYFGPQVNLVIQKGKIIALPGLHGQPVDFPADVVIDLHGMTMIPGLFNTHCHLQFFERSKFRELQIKKNLADCLERGVTNIRDTLCFDLEENRVLVERIACGDLRGPRIHQAIHVGPIGDTYAPRQGLMTRFMFPLIGMPLINYSDKRSGVVVFRPDASVREVRDAVQRASDERGAAAIKFCDQQEHFLSYKPGARVITGKQLEAAVDEAARRGLPTTMHNVTVDGFRQSTTVGITSLAHMPIDGELTEADANLLAASKTVIEPTFTVAYYMSYNMKGSPVFNHPEIQRMSKYRDATFAAYMKETWLPELQKIHERRHESLQTGEMKLYHFVDLSTPFRFYTRYITAGGRNLRLLVEGGAGRRLACGSDAGPSDCSPAVIDQELSMFDFVLNRDDQKLFTAADALCAATLNSARSMGIEAQFGSIKAGKTADLAVLNGDPLQDFHLIGRPVQALFMDGKLVVNHCILKATQPIL